MENKTLDQLFKAGLDTTVAYPHAEQQWQQVATRLAQRKKRRPVLWWILGAGLGLVVLYGLFIPSVGGTPPPLGAFGVPVLKYSVPERPLVPVANVQRREVGVSIDEASRKFSGERLPTTKEVRKCEADAKPLAFDDPSAAGNEPPSAKRNDPLPRQEILTYHSTSQTLLEKIPLLTGAVRYLPVLAVKKVSSQTEQDLSFPLLTAEVLPPPSKARDNRFALEVGLQKEYLSTGKVDNIGANVQVYAGLAVFFGTRWEASLAYSWGDVQRSIAGDPTVYGVPVVNPPQVGELPATSLLAFKNSSLEARFGYRLPYFRKLAVSLQSGLQWNSRTTSQVDYTYQGIYQPQQITATLPGTDWRLTDFFAGIDLRYPLARNYWLNGRYQKYFPRQRSTFRWPSRQRVQLGLSWHF